MQALRFRNVLDALSRAAWKFLGCWNPAGKGRWHHPL